MVSAVHRKLVAKKLDALKEERDNLQALVDDADKVMEFGHFWLTNVDAQTMNAFKDISQKIEDMTISLGSWHSDSLGSNEENAMNQETVLSETAPYPQYLSSRPFQASDDSELKSVVIQIKELQEAISSLSNNIEKISEKQTAMEESVESLSVKCLKVGQDAGNVEKELESIYDAQDSQENKIENIEKQLDAVKSEFKNVKQSKKDLRVIQKYIEELNAKVENHADGLTNLDALEQEIKTLRQQSEAVSASDKDHSLLLQEMTGKIDDMQQNEQKRSEEIKEFEGKVASIEQKCSEMSNESENICKDVQEKYMMMCQVVAGRLEPLEKMRNVFNEKLNVRTNNVRKLDKVSDQLAEVLAKFSQLEKKCDRQAIGFSALRKDCKLANSEWVTFTDTISNMGNHFDISKGLFLAPTNGLYTASLSAALNSKSMLVITKLPKGYVPSKSNFDSKYVLGIVGKTDTWETGSVSVVSELKDGDMLCVINISQQEAVLQWITFSCCKIA